jgi:hypothetical protein
MFAEEIFDCYSFNPIRVKHSLMHVKRFQYLFQDKKGNFHGISLNYPEPELEKQFGFAAAHSRSRKKYF